MTVDPVCKMELEPKQAAAKVEYQRVTYYFCSTGCHRAFTSQPGKYARPGEAPPAAGGPHRR